MWIMFKSRTSAEDRLLCFNESALAKTLRPRLIMSLIEYSKGNVESIVQTIASNLIGVQAEKRKPPTLARRGLSPVLTDKTTNDQEASV